MTRRDYSEETKAAVMAALLTGQSVSAIAQEYKIPAATIRSWKSRQLHGEGVANLATEKKDRIGELLLGYVEECLTTLRIQVRAFADKVWLKEQPASELAVLHGVVADKTIRILEALAVQGEGEDAPET